jgi:1-phosphatidylinositol phosphodiesterase
MQYIKFSTKLSELALPGTHDSAASEAYGNFGDVVGTQAMSFRKQLEVGIRFFDIRVRHIENVFTLHHGEVYLHVNFGDFLNDVNNYLNEYPSEVVLFRLTDEYKAGGGNTRSMMETLNSYLNSYWRILRTTDMGITIGQARGRMIIMCFHGHVCDNRGLNYHAADIQDKYEKSSNWELHDKWMLVHDHLYKAADGDRNKFFINYLSASHWSLPYFVVSGHSSPGTDAPRLATGYTTLETSEYFWPYFPRLDCFIGICTISFEGTNILTRDQLLYVLNAYQLSWPRSVGIIVTDFPGDWLINEIVHNNDRYLCFGITCWL